MKLTLGVVVALTAICVLAAGFAAGPGIAAWFIIPTCAIGVIAALAHAVAARTRSRLAALAEHIETVSGECFELIADPPFHIFAQIGYTPQLARWYCMPIEWESVVRADDTAISLEASPATGYVARLESIGGRRAELIARDASLRDPFDSFPTYATP